MLYAGAILVLSVASAWHSLWAMHVPHAASVPIEGAIDAQATTSAERVIMGLRGAFEHDHLRAVILGIDGPSGTNLQVEVIHPEIGFMNRLNPENRIVAAEGEGRGLGAAPEVHRFLPLILQRCLNARRDDAWFQGWRWESR